MHQLSPLYRGIVVIVTLVLVSCASLPDQKTNAPSDSNGVVVHPVPERRERNPQKLGFDFKTVTD